LEHRDQASAPWSLQLAGHEIIGRVAIITGTFIESAITTRLTFL
jgi:hypothetical protein